MCLSHSIPHMLFLKSWLSDYINLNDYTNSQLAEIISTKSSEVEEIHEIQDYFGGKVVVGQIKNARQHPNADKLKIFDVDLGDRGSVQIASGAPNIKEGLIVPVALDGARLPHLTIQAKPLRGEKSEGMCCGKSELALETGYSEGLWELTEELQESSTKNSLGKSICQALPQYFPKDVLFDIKVLPNRIGVFGSYLGFSLELATILGDKSLLTDKARALLNPAQVFEQINSILQEQKSDQPSISFEDKTGITNSFLTFDLDCHTEEYHLPHDHIKRMFLTETNLVGNITDLSNYILYDIGQPTHFFSNQKTTKNSTDLTWTIRKLSQDTKFKGLGNLKDARLQAGTNVLQDQDSNILAIPGISGAHKSKVDQDTRVIVEIANFYDEDIARSSFSLKYRSDGSKVWAGSVNKALTLVALIRLRQLVPEAHLSLISGWNEGENIDNLASLIESIKPTSFDIDIDSLAQRIDSRPATEWRTTLEKNLNLIGRYENQIFTRELFYSNLTDSEDILEDVIRLIGFNNLNEEYAKTSMNYQKSKLVTKPLLIKKIFTKHGFDEVITRPFVAMDQLRDKDNVMEVAKASSALAPFVRDSLFPSLMISLTKNVLDGHKTPSIFELNKIYRNQEKLVESLHVDGLTITQNPYILTSLAQDLLRSSSSKESEVKAVENEFGKGYNYITKNINITILEVKNTQKKLYGLPLNKRVYHIHCNLTNWDYSVNLYPKYNDESEYPSISRDYSFSISKDIKWQNISNIINSNSNNFDYDISVKPEERLSQENVDRLQFRVSFTSYDRTLSSEEIKKWEQQIIPQILALGDIKKR